MSVCPSCRVGVPIHQDGTTKLHAVMGAWCPGSGVPVAWRQEVLARDDLHRRLARRVRA